MKRQNPSLRLACALVTLVPAAAVAAPVNLATWTAESYPAVSGFGAGVWNVAPGGAAVFQSVNGQPTLFVGDFNAFGSDVRGKIKSAGGDDDYVGFAIGYRNGDTGNATANYLLIDWKQGTQAYDFGTPASTPGSTAYRGLAVSRVTGIPTADEFWGHVDFSAAQGGGTGGVTEMARGTTLGDAGWVDNREYEFRFIFQPNNLKVYVDGSLELDVSGSFADGRLAFYNFSQAAVTYSAFTLDRIPVVPEPETYALMLAGMGALGAVARRRRSA
jgi:hypothetical protein